MLNKYPISSQELNDRLLLSWEKTVRLLGIQVEGQPDYSGVYELLQASGEKLMESISGIPHIGTNEVFGGHLEELTFSYYRSILKNDYIMRKLYNNIRY